MKENKLSREGLLKEFDDIFRGCPLTKKGIQAHKQIKSHLTPIPEDVLNEFVGEQADKRLYFEHPDRSINIERKWYMDDLKSTLKEYDELKEGG